jgi:putative ABC transport system permease protein
MFFHFIMRAIWHRKSRTVAAFSAIILGTGVIGGLFNVYYDVSNKMSKEFRTYGANLLIYPTDKNSGLSLEQVHKIGQQIPSGKIIGMTPNQYSMVYVENQPLVLVGIWFDQMKKVSPYWNVDGEWVTERGNREEAMVGVEVAEKYLSLIHI